MYYGTPPIVTSGLVLNLDAANSLSYTSGSTTWYDLSGNNTSGSLVNGTGYNLYSWVLDGVDDYLTLPSSLDSLNGLPEASLNIWLRLNSSSNSAGRSGLIQLSGYNNSNGNLYFYTDTLRVGGIWLDIFRTTREFTGDWAPVFNATNWHMLTVTTTPGANGWKMYLNALLRYQTTGQSTVAVSSSLFTGLTLGLNSGRDLWGNISNCYVYNRALTQDEITQNFNALKGRFGIQ